MKEYEIKEKIHVFKTLKRIEIDLIMIGFLYMDKDEGKRRKIREARMLLLDVFDEVNKELEELNKLKERRKEDGKQI